MTAKLFTMLIGIGSKSIYFNLFKDKRSLRRNSYLHSFIAKALAELFTIMLLSIATLEV
jgi:hypothetical protein